MKKRGRLQEGMYADITIFNPETVDGMAGYESGTSSLPSKGIEHVIVNGETVVRDGALVHDVFPGEPIRGRM
jgi:N-acyl-D-glutamate deacylase